jgi:release factor glutamine methyltransferase
MHRRVAQGAPEWLAPHGRLLVETSERQAAGTVSIVRGAGLVPRVVRREEVGATVVVGSLPARRPGADRTGS